ncbi:GLPGLI family protein [Prevotella dentasini]|uniref:GLPGLI family protein n=1 Tax=Prevotella dentasini TaxID=589537 RepID=UPI0021CE1225|nr:GLPGLI family protein [Prevotella dentasini]
MRIRNLLLCCFLVGLTNGWSVPVLRIVYSSMFMRDTDSKALQDIQYLDIASEKSHFYSYNAQRIREINDSLNRRGNMDLSLRQRAGRPYFDHQSYEVYKGIPQKERLTYTSSELGDFRYEEEIPNLHWAIQDRDTTILEHRCQAATTTFRGRTWRVWFALDIPIPDGPWKLCGLPGLILKAEDSKGHFSFDCVGIMNVEGKDIEVRKENYHVCTPREYFNIFKEIRTNPIGFLNRTRPGKMVMSDDLRKVIGDADIRNNPEKLAKIVYLEDYDAEKEE